MITVDIGLTFVTQEPSLFNYLFSLACKGRLKICIQSPMAQILVSITRNEEMENLNSNT